MTRLPLAGAVVVLVAGVGFTFTGGSFALFVAALTATWIVVGVGSNVIIGMTGMFALHGAACLAIGGYGSAILQTQGAPWLLAVAGATAIGTGVMTAVMVPVLRLEAFFVAIASFMLVLLVQEIANRWISLTNGPYGLPVLGPGPVAGLSPQQVNYLAPTITAVLAVTAYGCLQNSTLGVRLRATRDAHTAAQASGINVPRHRLYALVISNILVCLAGTFMAPLIGVVDPTMFGATAILSVLLVTWLGGLDVAPGPVLGAVFVILLPQLITGLQAYTALVNTTLLLVVLILWPNGLLGSRGKASVLK